MTHIKYSKYIVTCLLVICCLFLAVCPVFAEETVTQPVTETQPVTTAAPVVSESTPSNGTVNVFVVGESGTTTDANGNTIPWTQGGSGDSLVESLFGKYTPYNAAGVAAIDWGWLADVALFAVVLICFFKILGGVIKRA